ncbi:MAG: CpsD/CapB family tyrosine-protein kinase [Ruminococcaceae bacterium]|nr:CpsD/CapB family tyrosine-protein kinase [Oscillospiraceae bacterium]
MKEKVIENKKHSNICDALNYESREAYNLLRTNISFAFPDTVGGKVIGVCSSCPQEGKSTTSINLTYSLAEAGNKVLLIDADMRRPSVYTTLEIPMEPGLSETLSGNENIKVQHGVHHENMDVLSSGHIPPNPSELIGSQRMATFLDGCKEKYDYIIVDLPPVLSVSDPVAVSKYLDGMIIVVRHGKTRRRDVVETIRQLEYVGVKILGFVYNRIGAKSGKDSKKHYYYGDYHSKNKKGTNKK